MQPWLTMLGSSFSSSEGPWDLLNGADAEADAKTGAGTDAGTDAGNGVGAGAETIRPNGAVGASCSTFAVIVTGAMVAASALALSSANSLARASVLTILRPAKLGR